MIPGALHDVAEAATDVRLWHPWRRRAVLDVVDRQAFDDLQAGLGTVLALHREGSTAEHVVVVLPSLSLPASLQAYYDARLPSLEHRYLLSQTMLHRRPGCEVVFVASLAPDPSVWDYYIGLAPPADRAAVARRSHVVSPEDPSPRPLATKLLGRADLLERVRALVAGRPAFIEPYNVTDAEVDVAVRLQVPINGSAPEFAFLGHKSGGRRVFAEAGVPSPTGHEDVRSADAVVEAALSIRAIHPEARSVVVKLDDNASGIGNVVLELGGPDDTAVENHVRAQVSGLPAWYVEELRHGGVVEELVIGQRFRSPSVQADIEPGGQVVVLGTHEQELSGPHGHTYEGCRFPADPAYASLLAGDAEKVGQALARHGATGRFSVDYAVAWRPAHGWTRYALEINLRRGGTSPPMSLLTNLDPGRYETGPGRWLSAAGDTRCYRSTDNLVQPRWLGLEPGRVIDAVRGAGLGWDRHRRTGVVLHLLSCLAVDGRMGLTAIARTSVEADALYDDAVDVLGRLEAPAHRHGACPPRHPPRTGRGVEVAAAAGRRQHLGLSRTLAGR
jgi:hypothetical protein